MEYEGGNAGARANAAAARLNAFLDGEGRPVLEEVEGSARAAWVLLIFLATVALGGTAVAYRRLRVRLGQVAP
jgi:hypothetical protein